MAAIAWSLALLVVGIIIITILIICCLYKECCKRKFRKVEADAELEEFTIYSKKPSSQDTPSKKRLSSLQFSVTSRKEILVAVDTTSTTAAGICVFEEERRLSFYEEEYPDCCQDDHEGNPDKYERRNIMSAISLWSSEWEDCDVTLLCDSKESVKYLENPSKILWQKVRDFENKYKFKIYFQWATKGTHAAIDVANKLAKRRMLDWYKTPYMKWERTRVTQEYNNFHVVSHPGSITINTVQNEKRTNN